MDAGGALASPGGRAVAGDALASLGGKAVTWDVLASPGGRANARGRVVLTWEGRAGDVLASPGDPRRADAGGRVVLAWEGRAEAGDGLASPGGRS